ncbi:LysR family transcriptional regulator [Companilactobacillus nuruki]|uniref:LysR family transcriptional regulator n=1 Tax=Companilactobacillus nuruki TaxID=1993540 RepID=A0A2N7AVV4_9LACO|nr:LysR family transcriptional regulator [Companilactobacillus nuruki]PMD72472.1 LysR family transcriptional regulator [Companilactobacillus nuruki]
MIDNYLLQELITFEKYGTLAATAEQLSVTQPTVTRGMQKLEDDLGVRIFDRKPNKITLTKTGQIAAIEAKKVLQQNQLLIDRVQKYDYNNRILKIGSIAPGPLIVLKNIQLESNVRIINEFISNQNIDSYLQNNDFSILITNQEIQNNTLESYFIGSERLSVNLDKFTFLANKASVKFKDLKGISFIVLSEIGIWKDIIQAQIPNAKFLYQNQVDAFTEITNYSNFPYFTTNLSKLEPDRHPDPNDDRVQIPISDHNAKIDFYAVYKRDNRSLVNPLIKKIIQTWI